MIRILVVSSFLFLAVGNAIAADGTPEIQVVDGKLSIQAVSVTLSQFLRSLDIATGMNSKVVAADLANQKMSVRLSGLDLDAAIHKSFQGLPWNYVYIPGKGITVVDRAQAVTPPSGGISSSPVQSIVNDTRNDNPPPPIQPIPISQPQPPSPANASGNPSTPPMGIPNPQAQPAATAQPGVTAPPPTNAPVPTFAPIGGALGQPLPTGLPTTR